VVQGLTATVGGPRPAARAADELSQPGRCEAKTDCCDPAQDVPHDTAPLTAATLFLKSAIGVTCVTDEWRTAPAPKRRRCCGYNESVRSGVPVAAHTDVAVVAWGP